MTTKLIEQMVPCAEVVQASEYDIDGSLTHERDIDYYQHDIEHLPVGTKLYTAAEIQRVLDAREPAVVEITETLSGAVRLTLPIPDGTVSVMCETMEDADELADYWKRGVEYGRKK